VKTEITHFGRALVHKLNALPTNGEVTDALEVRPDQLGGIWRDLQASLEIAANLAGVIAVEDANGEEQQRRRKVVVAPGPATASRTFPRTPVTARRSSSGTPR